MKSSARLACSNPAAESRRKRACGTCSEGRTEPMRSKEFAHDYRYFPDPDLLPVRVSAAWLAEIAAADAGAARRAPQALRSATTALSAYDAGVLTATRALADYFEAVVKAGAPAKDRGQLDFHRVAAPAERRRERDRRQPGVARQLAALICARSRAGSITAATGKKVFAPMFESGKPAAEIIAAEGLSQIQDTGEIERLCREVIEKNPDNVAKYRARQRGRIQIFCRPGDARLARPGQSASRERHAEAVARLAEPEAYGGKNDAERRRQGAGIPLATDDGQRNLACRSARQARRAVFYPKASTPGCTTEGVRVSRRKAAIRQSRSRHSGLQRRFGRGAGKIQGQVQAEFSAAERSGFRRHRSLRRAAHEEFSGKVVSRDRAQFTS